MDTKEMGVKQMNIFEDLYAKIIGHHETEDEYVK